MNHSQSYERIIPVRARGKQLLLNVFLLLLYTAVAVVGGVFFLQTFQPAVALLTVLLTISLILLTKKYMQIEYEYAFEVGKLTVAKIYGKHSRKVLAEVDLSTLVVIDYDCPHAREEILRMKLEKTVDALTTKAPVPALLLVWEENKKEKNLLRIESDERTEELLRRYYPHVCSTEFRRKIHQA